MELYLENGITRIGSSQEREISLNRVLNPGLKAYRFKSERTPGRVILAAGLILPAVLGLTARVNSSAIEKNAPSPVMVGTRADCINLVFAGDIMMADCTDPDVPKMTKSVEDIMDEKGAAYVFGNTPEVLRPADLAIANLEGTMSGRGKPAANKKYTFRTNPKYTASIVEAGVDIVSLANNHILDYGTEAFFDTLKHLADNGLMHIGAGRNIGEAMKPLYVDVKGSKVAILASSLIIPFNSWRAGDDRPGISHGDNPAMLLKKVADARKQADIVAVYLHWGIEYTYSPLPQQRELAKRLIDAGADMVIGTHPHVVQGLEVYKGKTIAYSIGELVFWRIDPRQTMLLEVSIDKETGKQTVRVIPSVIQNYTHRILDVDKTEGQALLDRIEKRSFGVDIDNKGYIRRTGDGALPQASQAGK